MYSLRVEIRTNIWDSLVTPTSRYWPMYKPWVIRPNTFEGSYGAIRKDIKNAISS